MKQERLKLYTVDLKYIRNLAQKDHNVLSISPQVGKSSRPFIGIIVICDTKQYCVPFSSPKPKHESMKNDLDFTKIYAPDGKLIGVLNFNNMIPVRGDVITPLNITINKKDLPDAQHYKLLTQNQLTYCQQNQEAIVRKANKLYHLVTTGKAKGILRKRCCNFSELEGVLDKYGKT